MREGRSPQPLGRFAVIIFIVLLVYCVISWLPPVATSNILGISANAWAGLGLFIIAPILGLIYTMSTPVDEEVNEGGIES